MKKLLRIVFGLSILLLTISACGSSQSAAEKEATLARVAQQVENFDFTFEANYVYPTGFKSMYLSPYYDVKVSKDTVAAFLPYFGRVYTAPMNPNEGGIQFISKEFEYKVAEGKKANSWYVDINVKDAEQPVYLQFEIWGNGNARLFVRDQNKQPISFQGTIVERQMK